jgi:flagellar basal body-associated protein FliL
VSFAIVSLIILVVIAIIAIPILIRVFGEAASRNPNRPEGGGEDGADERDPASGPGRE